MAVLNPGILSSLSTVPPVCPRPRPLILATLTPQAATMGPVTRVVLSPTPPVLCLSALIPHNGRQIHHVPGMRHLQGQVRYLPVIHALKINSHQHGRHLIIRECLLPRIRAPYRAISSRQKGTAPLFFSIRSYILISRTSQVDQVQSSPEAAGPGYIPLYSSALLARIMQNESGLQNSRMTCRHTPQGGQ